MQPGQEGALIGKEGLGLQAHGLGLGSEHAVPLGLGGEPEADCLRVCVCVCMCVYACV